MVGGNIGLLLPGMGGFVPIRLHNGWEGYLVVYGGVCFELISGYLVRLNEFANKGFFSFKMDCNLPGFRGRCFVLDTLIWWDSLIRI